MIEFKVFKDFVDEIMESNSSNHKKAVLEKYKNNHDIRFFLRYVFDPFIVNGISGGKIRKKLSDTVERTAQLGSKGVLTTIATMRTGNEVAVRLVKDFAKDLDSKTRELFYKVVTKNLPIGISSLTINRAMPGLIPTFNIMLAEKYENSVDYVEGKEFTLTRKIDGGRIIMIKENGIVNFYTRAGQLYEGLIELEQEAMHFPDGIMLDGEITLLNDEGLDNKEQYKQTMMITRKLGLKTGVKMLVFDCMTSEEFYAEKCDKPYKQRRETLENLSYLRSATFFKVLPTLYTGSEINRVSSILKEQIARGEEGIMLNLNDGLYCFGRCKDLLKVKKMHDVDLVVVGLDSGNNSNANRLGAFIVNYKGHRVRVGSGIDLKTREEVWANKDEYIGKVITVQYFEETSNQQGGISLRFPVFLGFRDDKEGDY